ncbi:uncharacterized protein [Bemisia tabaci]|uniref:uncharacterized protein isoform X2 n=2 Tax=Bemisia tabaci TaxID=7038 RepID=UPI003B288DC8
MFKVMTSLRAASLLLAVGWALGYEQEKGTVTMHSYAREERGLLGPALRPPPPPARAPAAGTSGPPPRTSATFAASPSTPSGTATRGSTDTATMGTATTAGPATLGYITGITGPATGPSTPMDTSAPTGYISMGTSSTSPRKNRLNITSISTSGGIAMTRGSTNRDSLWL